MIEMVLQGKRNDAQIIKRCIYTSHSRLYKNIIYLLKGQTAELKSRKTSYPGSIMIELQHFVFEIQEADHQPVFAGQEA